MKPINLTIILFLLFSFSAYAQRTRPDTDVNTGEEPFEVISIHDNAIVLYAIYIVRTNEIRSYSLWNDSESVATARIEFGSGDPIEIIAQPGSRNGARVQARGYLMESDIEGFRDTVRIRAMLGNDRPVRVEERPDRSPPFER